MPWVLYLALPAAGAIASWWANDSLERSGLKEPGETAPGIALKAAGAGIAIGLMVAGGVALWYGISRSR